MVCMGMGSVLPLAHPGNTPTDQNSTKDQTKQIYEPKLSEQHTI